MMICFQQLKKVRVLALLLILLGLFLSPIEAQAVIQCSGITADFTLTLNPGNTSGTIYVSASIDNFGTEACGIFKLYKGVTDCSGVEVDEKTDEQISFDNFLRDNTVAENSTVPYSVALYSDAGGYRGCVSIGNFVEDSVAPNAPSVTATTPTNDTTPTWSWSTGGNGGSGNYRYRLDNSDMSAGTTLTSSTNYTSGVLSEGGHTLYVQERDAAWNWSNTGSKAIVIDTTAPVITVTSDGGNGAGANYTTSTAAQTISGTCSDNVQAGTVGQIATEGSAVITFTDSDCTNGDWSGNVTLNEGANAFTIRHTDTAGNPATDSVTITLDTTPPTLTVTSPASVTVWQTGATATFSGTCGTDTVLVYQNHDQGAAPTQTDGDCSDGTWSYSIPINSNACSTDYRVFVEDSLGNSNASVMYDFCRDNTTPVITITTNGGNGAGVNFTTATAAQTVSGTCSDGYGAGNGIASSAQLSMTDSDCSNGNWSGTITLSEGANAITVTHTDAAGNPGTDSITITLDTTPPALARTNPVASPKYFTAPASFLNGTCGVDTNTITLTINGGAGALEDDDCSDGTWSVTASSAVDSCSVYAVNASDSAGNTNSVSTTFCRDATNPVITITSDGGNGAGANFTTATAAQTVSGTCSDTFPDVASSAQLAFTDSDCTNGTWSGTITLSAGANVITVTHTDKAGRTGTDSVTITYSVDGTPPTISISAPNSGTSFTSPNPIWRVSGVCSTDAINLNALSTLPAGATFSDSDCSDGTWSLNTYHLQNGANTFAIVAEDAATNQASDSIVITFSNATPNTVYPVESVVLLKEYIRPVSGSACSSGGVIPRLNCELATSLQITSAGSFSGMRWGKHLRAAVTQNATYAINGVTYDYYVQGWVDSGSGEEKFLNYYFNSDGTKGAAEAYPGKLLPDFEYEEGVKAEWDNTVTPKVLSINVHRATSDTTPWANRAETFQAEIEFPSNQDYVEAVFLTNNKFHSQGKIGFKMNSYITSDSVLGYGSAYQAAGNLTGGAISDTGLSDGARNYQCISLTSVSENASDGGEGFPITAQGNLYSDARTLGCASVPNAFSAATVNTPASTLLDLLGDVSDSVWTLP